VSFPRYPKYRDSGVEWWGEMPEDWGLFPAKRSFVRRKELNSGMKCENRLSLTLGGVVPRDLADLDGLQASEFETYQLVHAEDLVFKLIDLQNIKTSRVGLVPEIGIMSPAYIRVEPNKSKAAPKFAYWFFTNLYNRCIFNELGGGVRQTISSEELLLLPYPALPLPEQTAIAAFLDRETAKIDGLVAEQRRLMELLKEKRQAVISHAVTKGLNPDAPMKPSGIEWLGDVPEHWERSKPKYFSTKIVDGVHFKPTYVDEGVPFVTVRNLTAGLGISFENLNYITEEDHAEYFKRANPEKGDVLLTKDGATLGVARVIETDRVFSIFVSVALLKPIIEMIDPWFLCYSLESDVAFQQFKAGELGSALKHIHLVNLRNVSIPLPPLDEQKEIVQSLDREIDELEALVAEAQRAIDLLQERRTALISAAVTGQIDVRQLAEKKAA